MSKKLTIIIIIIIIALFLVYNKTEAYHGLLDEISQEGVSKYDPAQSYHGYTIVPTGKGFVVMIDMNGTIVHQWNNTIDKNLTGTFEYLDDCSILAIMRDSRFVHIGKNSEILWSTDVTGHHDITIQGDTLMTSGYKTSYILTGNRTIKIREDTIIVTDNKGVPVKEVSFLNILRKTFDMEEMADKSASEHSLVSDGALDLFHVNKLEVLNVTHNPLFREGYILFSARNIDLIGVIDPEAEELVWYWNEDLDAQHSPVMTKNNTVLIFDNGAIHRKYSRIIEINPATKKIVWEYTSIPKKAFYSRIMGSVEELPNGNMLVTESLSNRVFEITRNKDIVWDYRIKRDSNNTPFTGIFRSTRINPEQAAACFLP